MSGRRTDGKVERDQSVSTGADTAAHAVVPAHPTRRSPLRWAPWAAGAWAAGFAAGSVYLAAGGTAGLGLIAAAIGDRIQSRDPGLVAVLWVTVGLKLAAAALALSSLHPWSGPLRRGLVMLLGAAGAFFVLWGGAYVVQGALVTFRIVEVPASWGPGAGRWYLLCWGPLWLLGGGLFLASARRLGAITRRTTQ